MSGDPSTYPTFPSAPFPTTSVVPSASNGATLEEPKRRGRPRRELLPQALAEGQPAELPKRKARKAEEAAPDNIQCIFRTLQQPEMEPFYKAYDILRAMKPEGRGRVLAVLNQVLA